MPDVSDPSRPDRDLDVRLGQTAARVRDAARHLAHQSSAAKNDALANVAQALRDRQADILDANAADLAAGRDAGLQPAFIDRLSLDAERIEQMAGAVEEIIGLDDPVGRVDTTWVRPNGLRVGKRRIPLGVIGMIYESRPNVTSDAAALCLKSGNGVVLKGGSAALQSNRAIHRALTAGMAASLLADDAVGALGFVDTADRAAVKAMVGLDDFIDVIIPRGGPALIGVVTEHARIPVIKHDAGVCHVVIDRSARPKVVDDIVINAKVQRPGVCNAVETLVVVDDAVDAHLGRTLERLVGADVKLHLDARSRQVAQACGLAPSAYSAADQDAYRAEFLGRELAVAVVDDLADAIDHINTYGSHHTDALLTENYTHSQQFQSEVDSAVVMINASTRFSDGNQLGLGAEIGISTTRLHAYGPMGLDALTTTKFIVLGNGQIRP